MSASLAIERLWPWVGAIVAMVAWTMLGAPYPSAPNDLFAASATVASVFASFLGVSKAIILSYRGTPAYTVLQKLNYTEVLYGYLKAGIIGSVIFALLSILGFFVDKETIVRGYKAYPIFSAAWVGAGTLALFTYVRITNILFKLLRQP